MKNTKTFFLVALSFAIAICSIGYMVSEKNILASLYNIVKTQNSGTIVQKYDAVKHKDASLTDRFYISSNSSQTLDFIFPDQNNKKNSSLHSTITFTEEQFQALQSGETITPNTHQSVLLNQQQGEDYRFMITQSTEPGKEHEKMFYVNLNSKVYGIKGRSDESVDMLLESEEGFFSDIKHSVGDSNTNTVEYSTKPYALSDLAKKDTTENGYGIGSFKTLRGEHKGNTIVINDKAAGDRETNIPHTKETKGVIHSFRIKTAKDYTYAKASLTSTMGDQALYKFNISPIPGEMEESYFEGNCKGIGTSGVLLSPTKKYKGISQKIFCIVPPQTNLYVNIQINNIYDKSFKVSFIGFEDILSPIAELQKANIGEKKCQPAENNLLTSESSSKRIEYNSGSFYTAYQLEEKCQSVQMYCLDGIPMKKQGDGYIKEPSPSLYKNQEQCQQHTEYTTYLNAGQFHTPNLALKDTKKNGYGFASFKTLEGNYKGRNVFIVDASQETHVPSIVNGMSRLDFQMLNKIKFVLFSKLLKKTNNNEVYAVRMQVNSEEKDVIPIRGALPSSVSLFQYMSDGAHDYVVSSIPGEIDTSDMEGDCIKRNINDQSLRLSLIGVEEGVTPSSTGCFIPTGKTVYLNIKPSAPKCNFNGDYKNCHSSFFIKMPSLSYENFPAMPDIKEMVEIMEGTSRRLNYACSLLGSETVPTGENTLYDSGNSCIPEKIICTAGSGARVGTSNGAGSLSKKAKKGWYTSQSACQVGIGK